MAKSSIKKSTKRPRTPSPVPSASSSSASPGSAADSSSSSSSSGRSSASPEPEQAPQRARVDPSTQKYAPPKGFKPVKPASDVPSDLDWDALNDDKDLELWAVRVPAGIKAKYLDKVTLTLPSPSSAVTDPLQPVGSFSTKSKADFNVFLAPGPSSASSSGKRKRDEAVEEEVTVPGASELQSLVPLVPRKKEGNKLFAAPRPIAHTLLITRALPSSVLASTSSLASLNAGHSTLIVSQPSPVPGAILTASELLNPAQATKKKEKVLGKGGRTQPSELIKFRLDLAGGKGEGGKGRYENKPSEERVKAVRERGEPALPVGVVVPPPPVVGVEEGEGQVEGAAEDVEMGEAGGEEEVKSPKKEKKDKAKKKEKKSKEAGADGEPKKKKVKAE
ncbi:hypothetical protein JCM8547_007771 [Rhodosporidiobolus lusitaniae]